MKPSRYLLGLLLIWLGLGLRVTLARIFDWHRAFESQVLFCLSALTVSHSVRFC